MAIIKVYPSSDQAWDQPAINLNDLATRYSGYSFTDNANVTSPAAGISISYLGYRFYYSYNGGTLEDVYTIEIDSGQKTTTFFGSGITLDPSGVPTGGMIEAILAEIWSNSVGAFVKTWSMVDFSISITTFYAAVLTASTTDDLAVLKSILSGKDMFDLGSGNDRAHGYGGNDFMSGGGGRDNLRGGAGNDLLKGGAGNDRLFGGNGNDVLQGDGGNDLIDGGNGIDTLAFYKPGSTTPVTVDLAITGTQATGYGNDTIVGIENILGGRGNDTLRGDGGANLIKGGAGNDRVFGRGGNDTLSGNGGDDYINGGKGIDTLVVSSTPGATGGTSVDLRIETAQNTGYGLDTVVNIENLIGGAGNDTLIGNGRANLIMGKAGKDVIRGLGGNDTLLGNGDRDRLDGGGGADVLQGGGGNDRLLGGRGDDVLTGGAGADLFVFRSSMGQDRITDFTDDKDTLVLSSALGGGLTDVNSALALATDTGTDIVFDFGADGTLTLEGAGGSGTAFLSNDLVIV